MRKSGTGMRFAKVLADRRAELSELFKSVFTASEGAEEGAMIGALAYNLLCDTPGSDVSAFTADQGDSCLGCIIFSRLRYPQDERVVFVLGPVAIATAHQGQGIGQDLIRHGLDVLRQEGVDFAVTYGDPAFYSKLGFKQISETDAPAPYELQFPEGWQGQALTGEDSFAPLAGPSVCVDAFNNPAFW